MTVFKRHTTCLQGTQHVPSGVTNCWDLLFDFGARSRHQSLFEENIRKTGMCSLWTLIVKGSGVVFTHGEGISTPRAHHKGWQPSIKCANMTSKLRIFPFFYFYVFFPFYIFLLFMGLFIFFILLWSTRVFHSLLRILNCDEEIRPT